MSSPAEIVLRRRSKIMHAKDFEWLLGSGMCEECAKKIEMTALQGVEVCLNAAHFGDLAVCILCPHCDSLYYLHARKFVFGNSMPPFDGAGIKFIRRERLIEAHVNNILEMSDGEVKELAPSFFEDEE